MSAGATPVTAWTLRWSFPDGQQVTQLWYGSFLQIGPDVTVHHAPWGSMIPPAARSASASRQLDRRQQRSPVVHPERSALRAGMTARPG
ncbi:cellulose binding domain-containing protein [Solwaraspora sp. WMMD1047]|uniref:cellulose binding domain-containing protein n=1 Tax=Solwaraspora sp. WMMD1047 TaxID=3016102 RepID=UPI002417E7D8|nr:cellulose binding domain-containing protein [Solwaraspora sp. WMMD1047]MDG4830147.1 cellulose binding domain-containing protein [Solwaraspora sp. WMMD1047]